MQARHSGQFCATNVYPCLKCPQEDCSYQVVEVADPRRQEPRFHQLGEGAAVGAVEAVGYLHLEPGVVEGAGEEAEQLQKGWPAVVEGAGEEVEQ